MYTKEQLDQFLAQHVAAFNAAFFPTLKRNSSTIGREDLSAIKEYLTKGGELEVKLKKRAKKMFLMPLPDGSSQVCTGGPNVIAAAMSGEQVCYDLLILESS